MISIIISEDIIQNQVSKVWAPVSVKDEVCAVISRASLVTPEGGGEVSCHRATVLPGLQGQPCPTVVGEDPEALLRPS